MLDPNNTTICKADILSEYIYLIPKDPHETAMKEVCINQ